MLCYYVAGAAVASIALGSYLFVYHSHYYASALNGWGIGLLLGGWTLLLVLWTDHERRQGLLDFLKASFALLLFGGWLTYLSGAKTRHLRQQLDSDGLAAGARVSGFEIETRKGHSTQYIVFDYGPNSRLYKQRVANTDSLHFGDSLRIRYSASHPENVLVTGFRRQQDF